MRKVLSISLCVLFCLSLAACGSTLTKSTDEVGIWALKDIEFGEEMLNEITETLPEDTSREDALEMAKSFYLPFMAGFYLQFYEDGTGEQGYYIPEEYADEYSEVTNDITSFRWSSGKLIMQNNEQVTYTIKDSQFKIINDDITMVFEKIDKLEDIENASLFNMLTELEQELNH